MDVERPVPLGIYGGTIGIVVDGVGPPLVGSVPTVVCVVVMVPIGGIPMMMGGKDAGPPQTIPS